MKLHLILILLFLTISSFLSSKENYVLVIHGGAGAILKKNMSPQKEAAYRDILNKALEIGDSILNQGGTSADAVEQVIRIMEDCPLFNAGKGAVFAHDGNNYLDASFMLGKDLNAGAVAGIQSIKNPISAARMVMEQSSHVMLSGKGAEHFAKEAGLDTVPLSYFHTASRWQSWQRLLNKERSRMQKDNHGTVGCVALDIHGNLAAGTSTGGMTNKKYGRIGDSPVIGAGTYADNRTCAVSCTGHGEYYIRLAFAKDITCLMDYKNLTVQEACQQEIDKLSELGGTGGVIALDALGNVAMEFNSEGMYRGVVSSDGRKSIAIYK